MAMVNQANALYAGDAAKVKKQTLSHQTCVGILLYGESM